MSQTPSWSGYHHITLNVRDVAASERWYREVLGFVRLTDYRTDAFERVILRAPDGRATLGINRHAAAEADGAFDERRTGLDHLAFQVRDQGELGTWLEHFDALGVPHSEVKPGAVPGSFLLVFRDPDDIQLELFAPPTT